MDKQVTCPYCHGSGKQTYDEMITQDCSYCSGTGKVPEEDPLAGPGGA